MANSAWNVLVGVDFDTTNIKTKLKNQLKDYNQKIKLDVSDLDDVNLTFNVANQLFRDSIELIGSLTNEVYELDGALTEFKKVSDLSGTALDDYVDKLSTMGSKVARTASEMVESVTEFRKNGFNDEDAAQLGQISAMYQNVADEAISASDSASFIIAQMTAFGIEAENAMHIIDAVNETANQFSVSSGQLASSLGIVSSALSVGGNSFEEVIGLMTAGTEVTRNASKVARGLVSVQSRLNQVVDESSSTGKALTEWYEEHNIAIYDQQGQLLSLYEVLDQVAEIWPTLTKNEQAYYLNQQAGANQTQNLAAILSNFDHAVEATATALDSAGSAAQENARVMESLEAK